MNTLLDYPGGSPSKDLETALEKIGVRPLELLKFVREPREILLPQDLHDRAILSECEFAARRLGVHPRDLARDLKLPALAAGGSFVTGTSSELLYSSIATGTQLATFTTEDSLMKTLPAVIIPAGFFYAPSGATGKSLRVKGLGRLGTTGTPTFTWSIRLLTSSTWSAAGIGFSTAAITAGSGVTLAPWFIDIDLILRTIAAAGANSTIACMGELRGGTALAAGGGVYSIPGANTAFTAATFDTSVTAYLFLSAACGTSNGSNLIQLEMMKVFGEN